MTVNEIIQKIIDAGMADALKSPETAIEAAKKLGFSDEEIQQALDHAQRELAADELTNVAAGCHHDYSTPDDFPNTHEGIQ